MIQIIASITELSWAINMLAGVVKELNELQKSKEIEAIKTDFKYQITKISESKSDEEIRANLRNLTNSMFK